MRGLREFAEQQAERVQEAQREQFATLTLNTAVELTGAALRPDGGRAARPTSRRSRCATPCASSSPRRSRSSRPPARASCESPGPPHLESPRVEALRPRDRPDAARRTAARRASALVAYIAGPTLDDARATVAGLNADGKLATVDVLGEEITRPDEAEAITQAYLDVLEAIETDGLDANICVKLTGLGLKLDRRALPRRTSTRVVADAAARGTFVRIDMEDSSCDRRDAARSTASCASRGATTSASSCRRRCGARSPTWRRSPTCGRTSASARGSTSSRRRSRSRTSRPSARASSPRSRRCSRLGCYVGVATHDEWLIGQSLARAHRARGPRTTSCRCCSAYGRRGPGARRRRSPAARVRPIRPALVRVLAAAAAGEPEDRRLRRRATLGRLVPGRRRTRLARAGATSYVLDGRRSATSRAFDGAVVGALDVQVVRRRRFGDQLSKRTARRRPTAPTTIGIAADGVDVRRPPHHGDCHVRISADRDRHVPTRCPSYDPSSPPGRTPHPGDTLRAWRRRPAGGRECGSPAAAAAGTRVAPRGSAARARRRPRRRGLAGAEACTVGEVVVAPPASPRRGSERLGCASRIGSPPERARSRSPRPTASRSEAPARDRPRPRTRSLRPLERGGQMLGVTEEPRQLPGRACAPPRARPRAVVRPVTSAPSAASSTVASPVPQPRWSRRRPERSCRRSASAGGIPGPLTARAATSRRRRRPSGRGSSRPRASRGT